MQERPESRTIIKSVLALAGSLGLVTTGEGVETPQIADSLRKEGCDHLQGYAFSRPLAADAVEQWLDARAAANSSSTAP
jgi:EAL domain-containing protein (putative c-di-GMP-specific phosphodiesterase class I)